MKKTNSNQNMPDRTIRNNESANAASSSGSHPQNKKERFENANLDQHVTRSQHWDDATGTVQNKNRK